MYQLSREVLLAEPFYRAVFNLAFAKSLAVAGISLLCFQEVFCNGCQ